MTNQIEISDSVKSVRIVLKVKNLNATEIHKTQLAFEQFIQKSNGQKHKFERRVKRILKESNK